MDVGAMGAAPDGDFGPNTQDAARRLQWYPGKIAGRLRVPAGSAATHGTLEPYVPPAGVQADGFVRPGKRAGLPA